MIESERKERNEGKLGELYPTFRAKVVAIIKDLEGHGLRPRIQEAYRSEQDQLAAFNSGHSTLKYGFHNVCGVNGKPEALAVDLLDDDHPAEEGHHYLLMLASSAQAHGCETGIRWGLPEKARMAINEAIDKKAFGSAVEIGWDSCHIQPTGITAQQARSGTRPK